MNEVANWSDSHFLGRHAKAIHGIGKSGNNKAPARNQARSERPLSAAYFAVKRPLQNATARTMASVKKMIKEEDTRQLLLMTCADYRRFKTLPKST
jgi:hypothetical protein